jgi:hypothetical protein
MVIFHRETCICRQGRQKPFTLGKQELYSSGTANMLTDTKAVILYNNSKGAV